MTRIVLVDEHNAHNPQINCDNGKSVKHNSKNIFQSFELKTEAKNILSLGAAGSAATVIQVSTFMWLRTVMHYQYYHGGTFRTSFDTLYKEGGIRRLHKGLGIALLYVPACRFGDIVANMGTVRYMDINKDTSDMSLSSKTFCGTLVAGTWRVAISPIDMLKNSLQVNGHQAVSTLRNKIKSHGAKVLYNGSGATFVTCVSRDYPWFITYNYLNRYFDTHHKDLTKTQTVMKNAFVGLAACTITDTVTNGFQIVKTVRQVHTDKISYRDTIDMIIKKDGIRGLLCRGLGTRIIGNGIQGMTFSVLWKLISTN